MDQPNTHTTMERVVMFSLVLIAGALLAYAVYFYVILDTTQPVESPPPEPEMSEIDKLNAIAARIEASNPTPPMTDEDVEKIEAVTARIEANNQTVSITE